MGFDFDAAQGTSSPEPVPADQNSGWLPEEVPVTPRAVPRRTFRAEDDRFWLRPDLDGGTAG